MVDLRRYQANGSAQAHRNREAGNLTSPVKKHGALLDLDKQLGVSLGNSLRHKIGLALLMFLDDHSSFSIAKRLQSMLVIHGTDVVIWAL